ncbi:protein FAR1-RELATED SEQUENCE 5-like [Prosopis cineraria]|uniref:protein FAR1-RELATED SEQUENCE 5-like n=1 Tax=Prosopis cineraria TaxID=364024 RepID=UPI0024100E41|nr:protein FAR1-RELATED SEQUENCE 5-like [Prosopis cineraria]XP_054784480.1 protein FAR1-RELATED SEQUENCE 5-like [Prosopis cineraria]
MDTNLIPRLGLEFETLEEAWQYWVSYGGKTGFGVRKQYFSKSRKDGTITSYRYVCCKEGVRRPDKRDYKTIHPRPETRTGCKARMTVSRINGKYRIVDFVDEHNHPLHFPETVHLKASQRKENEDEKDVKIRELTAELQRERKRRAVLQQQLEIILRDVEEHSIKVSKSINDSLQRMREVEEKANSTSSSSAKLDATK